MSTTPPVSEVSDLQLIEQEDDIKAQVEEKYTEAKNYVTNIIRQIDIQERPTRESQIRMWKYLDLLWSGITNFYWNAGVQRYSPITADDLVNLSSSLDIDPTLLNKTINMIRPYGESIVGALTTAVPRNKYYPSDAESVDDINTSKAYTNIEQKIVLDNQMKLKIIQMIVNMLNGGFFALHNYPHSHERYGTISKEEMGEKNFRITNATCPECGDLISSSEEEVDEEEGIDTAAGTDIGLDETINEAPEGQEIVNPPPSSICPSCQTPIDPILETLRSQRLVPVGKITIPKTRVLLDVYGPLNVKIPCHASKKEEVLWCILEKEIHESQARRLFPKYRDKIVPGTPSGDLAYDRWARTQYENTNELNHYYVTMRWLYLQPDGYEILRDEESPKVLEALFPKGLLAVFANDILLFIEEAELEEYWTFSFNPIYKRLYGDPLLKAAIPLQETSNDLFQLEIETVKHAIPQSFADPEVLDFNAYAQAKSEPGSIFPAKMPAGRSLSDAIHTTITANLPKEVEVLETKIEKLFQFILGAFPSVFGGEASGSKTLGEYEQSRSQALQRLSANPQSVVYHAYAEAMGKSVKMYGEELVEDEAYVVEKGNSFVNVWIRKAHLQGRIGQVRPEVSEQFPSTWGQKKAAWLELVGLNNEVITQVLFHPENISMLKEITGMDDLYVPGDDQRNKQLTEIKYLISAPPVEGMMDPMTGQEAMPTSSVPIEPVDDDAIHIAVLSAFICSEVGQTIKEENPVAYMNLLLHLQEHQMRMQEQMMAQQMAQAQAQGDPNQVGEAQ
jgi:ssDNA-binding Zn-finger/Zn-ribbon topoisomerase 1